MAILYLDIETFSENYASERSFDLNKITKIISIQYKKENGELVILKEWVSGEKEILKQFYDDIRKMQERDKGVTILGHNLLRFDIPVLIQRMAYHDIDSMGNLNNFFHNTFVIDSMQCLLPFNEFRFKGLGAEKLSGRLGISQIVHDSKQMNEFYEKKQFHMIEEHVSSDISFMEELWGKMQKDKDKLKLPPYG